MAFSPLFSVLLLASASPALSISNVIIDGYGYSLSAHLAAPGLFPAKDNVTGWTVTEEALYSPEIESEMSCPFLFILFVTRARRNRYE